MKPDRVNTLHVFDNGDISPEDTYDEFPCVQHARFKARFREMANAMSQHPLADQLAHSIATLRRITEGGENH